MSVFDFFRNFFGRGLSNKEPITSRIKDDDEHSKNSFKKPIWQNDDDEDGDDFSDRMPRDFQITVFSDPSELTQLFEQQMAFMLEKIGFGNGIGNFDNLINIFGGNDFGNALPIPDKRTGPRDEVLKPSYGTPNPIFKFEDSTTPSIHEEKDKGIVDVQKPSYRSGESGNTASKASPFSFHSFGKSMSSQTIQRADGSIEHTRTVRDSEGNEEITITRQIGDKMHTTVTKRTKDGTEIKSEDIVNMDESELKGFDDKWNKNQIKPKDDPIDDFPWHKFFGPNPKL